MKTEWIASKIIWTSWLALLIDLATVFEDAQRQNEERFAKLADAQLKHACSHADLDEKFGALVKMMDEWTRNGRN